MQKLRYILDDFIQQCDPHIILQDLPNPPYVLLSQQPDAPHGIQIILYLYLALFV